MNKRAPIHDKKVCLRILRRLGYKEITLNVNYCRKLADRYLQ